MLLPPHGDAGRRCLRRLSALALCAALFGCDAGTELSPPSAGQAAAERLGLAATALSAPLPRPEFTLTDTGGRRYAFHQATAGRLTLLFFGYTSCPDVCPTQLASLAAGLRELPAEVREQVLVVFVGVDAARDTRERVRAWLDHFDAGFVGLTGSEAELAAAQQAALVPGAFVDERWEDGYTLAHASWVFVYTPDDQAHLRYGLGISAAQWAHDLGRLVRDGWPAA
jgi:protein SCO1/2